MDYYEDYNEYMANYSDYSTFYEIYLYQGFDFERPVYLFIWEIMVVITTIFNIIIIVVLLGRGMVNTTNIILVAIAVSDSLTGLVTLPTYIYVYQQFHLGGEGGHDAYSLTKPWCEAFMFSKFFLSRSFHTISIWLTVLLCFQRFISVWAPFRAHDIFTKLKTVVGICIISVLSTVMHVYHAGNTKAIEGLCYWNFENGCDSDCAYLWITFLFMHLIPCTLLLVFTAMMLARLFGSAAKMRDMTMSSSGSTKRRAEENRRISLIVILVIVVFLIPELPYGIFKFYTLMRRHSGLAILKLKTNRAFDCSYEILLVLSFHANFWIYTLMNKKFREGLRRTFNPVIREVYVLLGKRHSIVPTTESSIGDRTLDTEVHSKVGRGEEMQALDAKN